MMGHTIRSEYPSERLKKLADLLYQDIMDICEVGYAPTNNFGEHLLELRKLANILSDQDL